MKSNFSSEELCSLLDDVFALAYANYTSYEDAFEFALGLKGQLDGDPWCCVQEHLRKLLNLLSTASPGTYVLYRKYLNEIEGDFDNGSDLFLQTYACDVGNENCRGDANALFLKWLNNNNETVPIGLRPVVYKWGVWMGSDQRWNKVWQRYLGETDPSEKMTLLKSLAYSQESAVLSQLLEYAQNETFVRRQDYFFLCRSIASHPVGSAVIWNYHRNRMDSLVERFGLQDRDFRHMITDITVDFSTETELESMQQFFKNYPGVHEKDRESALENVRNNILWTKRSLHTIHEWLTSRYAGH